MESIRRQTQCLTAPELGLLRDAHEKNSIERPGRTLVGGIEFYSQLQWPVLQIVFGQAKIYLPNLLVTGRNDLVLGFDLFEDLLAHLGKVAQRDRRRLQPLAQASLGFFTHGT